MEILSFLEKKMSMWLRDVLKFFKVDRKKVNEGKIPGLTGVSNSYYSLPRLNKLKESI